MTYYAEQSCTAGRTAFFTGMTLRAGMIPPQLPGASYWAGMVHVVRVALPGVMPSSPA